MSKKKPTASKLNSTVKRYSAVPPVAAPSKGASAIAEAVAATQVKQAAVTEPVAAAATPAKATATPVAAAAKPTVDLTNLLADLHSDDADAAREAAVGLGASTQKSAVEPLIEVIQNTNGYFHSVVRAAAAHGLGQLGDARAIEPLIEAIHDTMAETSAEAVRALATLGDKRAVAPLITIVENHGGFFLATVRRAAVLALTKLGGDDAKAALKAVAANEHEDAVIRADASK